MQSYTRALRHHLCRGRRLVLGLILATLAIILTLDTLYGTFIETTSAPYDYQHVTFVNMNKDNSRQAEQLQPPNIHRVKSTIRTAKPTSAHKTTATAVTAPPTTKTPQHTTAKPTRQHVSGNSTLISKPLQKHNDENSTTATTKLIEKNVHKNSTLASKPKRKYVLENSNSMTAETAKSFLKTTTSTTRITVKETVMAENKENYKNSTENAGNRNSTNMEQSKMFQENRSTTEKYKSKTKSITSIKLSIPTTLASSTKQYQENSTMAKTENSKKAESENSSITMTKLTEKNLLKNSSKPKTNMPQSTTQDSSASRTTENLSRIQKECMPADDASNIKTPYKIYVYQLPSVYNLDIQREMSVSNPFAYCYSLHYCGMGTELYKIGKNNSNSGTNENSMLEVSIRDTQQFSLEVILHYKMLNSPYRTMDPDKAEVFYIPAYTGLNCLMFRGNTQSLIDDLFQYLRKMEGSHFLSGKPHVMGLSKIQREQFSSHCPTLLHPDSAKITFIGIEKEANPFWVKSESIWGKTLTVAPYPSYVHFIPQANDLAIQEYSNGIKSLNESQFILDVPKLADREVLLFLAASERRSNNFRAKMLDQFQVKVDKGYDDVWKSYNKTANDMPKQVMLKTSECSKDHRTTTIPWMRHSVFCLQPPGDSPTRKSIYDSILSGCIPILINGKFKTEYPFENYLNYSTFTYMVDEKVFLRYNVTVYDVVKDISADKIEFLFKNLLKVAKWFQYSLPGSSTDITDDAFTLLLDEIGTRHNLHKKLNAS